jgi:hypothetical protein
MQEVPDNNEEVYCMEYASKGVANAGLTTGIIGTALGAMNSGVLPNLFGGGNCGCSENMMVNRYEASQSARIAELETELKLRDANFYALSEVGKLRDYIDGRFAAVEKELCDQKVYNATLNSTVGCISGQVAALMSLTKMVIPNGSVCPAGAM